MMAFILVRPLPMISDAATVRAGNRSMALKQGPNKVDSPTMYAGNISTLPQFPDTRQTLHRLSPHKITLRFRPIRCEPLRIHSGYWTLTSQCIYWGKKCRWENRVTGGGRTTAAQ